MTPEELRKIADRLDKFGEDYNGDNFRAILRTIRLLNAKADELEAEEK